MFTRALFFHFALLVRLPNSFTVIANVLAAYTIGASGNIDFTELATLVAISLSLYYAGMIQNDCVDLAEDIRTQPHRPLASGKISLSAAWFMYFALCAAGIALSFSLSTDTRLFVIALLSCIAMYNFSGRESLHGCVLMGLCRALNWLMVLSAVGATFEYLHFAVVVGLYVMALTFISRDESYARRKSLLVLAALSLVFAALLLLFFIHSEPGNVLLKQSFVLVLLMIALTKLYVLQRDYRPENIRATVMFFILGMIPLDAILVLIAGYPLVSLLVLGFIFPGKFLAKKMYTT